MVIRTVVLTLYKFIQRGTKVLERVNRPLVWTALAAWLINGFAYAWERFGVSAQFGSGSHVALKELSTAAVVTLLLGIAIASDRAARRLYAQDRFSKMEWDRVFSQNKFLEIWRPSYLLTSTTVLVLMTVFFAIAAFDNSAKALACLLSDNRQYELAERVYRLAPDLDHKKTEDRYSTMASWHSSYTHEDPVTTNLKNAAVAKVYGSQSREMAGRYFYLGLAWSQGSDYNDEKTLYWQNKALELYKQEHAATKCMDVLEQLASYAEDIQIRKEYLNEAAKYASLMDEKPYVTTHILEYLASEVHDEKLVQIFRRNLSKYDRKSESDPLWTYGSVILFALFGSGFGCLLAKEQTLKNMINSANKNLSDAGKTDFLLSALDTVTKLKLIQLDLQAADRSSTTMLKVAESGHPSFNFSIQEEPNVERNLAIFKHEFVRLAVAATLIAWF